MNVRKVFSIYSILECKTGWLLDSNGNCYKKSDKMLSWKDASCECNKQGSSLATLADSSYNHLVINKANIFYRCFSIKCSLL